MYKFAPACEGESIVFGAARPGYSNQEVAQWIDFMQTQGIKRVCCLLCHQQLTRYGDLLSIYRQAFGWHRVCWAPIEDFQLAEPEILLQKALPFLGIANQEAEKVVVHCSGGVGRTGQVLAAWLVHGRDFTCQAAIATVRKMGRNPYEAAIAALLKGKNPWQVMAQLNQLLEDCRQVAHH